jgi:hypothetical protein
MKNTLLFLFLTALAATAFGQGRFRFANDSGSPIILSTNTADLVLADYPLAGQPLPTSGALPSGGHLVIGLYVGTSSSSLSPATIFGGITPPPVALNPDSGGNPIAGQMVGQNYLLADYLGGVTVFMQYKVWDARYPTFDAAYTSFPNGYIGWNHVFSMTLGSTAFFPPPMTAGASTWSAVGNENPLVLFGMLPEPTAFTLLFWGSLLAFARREKNRSH